MTYNIVTEGPSDVILIKELLKPEFDTNSSDFRVVDGDGASGVDSRARTILVTREGNVILVVDADSNDPRRIREQEQFLEEALGQVASRTRWKIVQVVPEIEALLFTNKETIEQLVGKEISFEQFIRGQYEPRRILDELLHGQSRSDIFAQRLPQIDLSAVREQPIIRELKEYLGNITQKAVA